MEMRLKAYRTLGKVAAANERSVWELTDFSLLGLGFGATNSPLNAEASSPQFLCNDATHFS
jgi:hypothetical protein